MRDEGGGMKGESGCIRFHPSSFIPHPFRESVMIARFFIDRPIFAVVISLVIVLAGGLAVFTLADHAVSERDAACRVGDYRVSTGPTPPRCDTVAAPIEEQVSGVEGMVYMSSHAPTTALQPAVGDL